MNFRRIGARAAGLALALSLVTVAAPRSFAETPAPVPLDPILAGLTPGLLEDYSTYAAQTGSTVHEVAVRFQGLDEFEQLVDAIRSDAPQSYVASRWDNGSGTVLVRQGYLARATAAAGRLNAKAGIFASQLSTESEQLAIVATTMKSLTAAGFSIEYLGFDVQSNEVKVYLSPGESKTSRNLPQSIEALLTEKQIGIRLTSNGQAGAAVALGGLAYSDCTAAFNVKSGSTKGISTANHCNSKPAVYDGNNLGATTPYSGRDVRWTRYTSGTASNTFRYKPGLYRQVTSSGNPTIGSLACKYGRTTGYHCATVTESGFTSSYGYTALYKTYDGEGRVRPGDSGGPWFRDSKGLGVTSGRIYYGDTTVADLFSGIGSLNLLGVTVITS